jgi:hypothetical protein
MRFCIVVVVGLFACKHELSAPTPIPPTAIEAEAFAKQFAADLTACDGGRLRARFDVDQLLSRAVAGQRVSRSEERDMRAGFERGFDVRSLCSPAKADVAWVRNSNVDNAPRPILRVLNDAGLVYFELVLDKQADAIRVVDVYLYSTGELMSQSVASMVGAVEGVGQTQLAEIKQHLLAGRGREARDGIRALPDALRKTKFVMLAEVTASNAMNDDAQYVKAIDAYAQTFPNDPSLDMVEIDSAWLRKDFKKTIEVLDRLDRRLGGDPYLDVLRSNAYLELADAAKAIGPAKRATQQLPDMERGWWNLAISHAMLGEHAVALTALTKLRDHFKADVSEAALRGDPRLGTLMASAEYAAWVAK